jgi:hypothetical protein
MVHTSGRAHSDVAVQSLHLKQSNGLPASGSGAPVDDESKLVRSQDASVNLRNVVHMLITIV